MRDMGRAGDERNYPNWIDPGEVAPYEKNAKIHTPEQVDAIAASIRRYGWQQDTVITADNVLVIGHGRRLAALEIGCRMPYHRVGKNADELTEAEIMALRLVDNMTNESAWDEELKAEEIRAIEDAVAELGEELEQMTFGDGDWFGREEKDGNRRQEGNEEYNAFLDKFEIKKTTDDCYTPDNIYDAVADWVAAEYGVDRATFVRPFYPGGDYQAFRYPEGCVVVDNPPFSILAQIIRWYCENGIRFFLFAPTLSLFTAVGEDVEYVPCGVSILYENGAEVNTSFIDNLGDNRIFVAGTLYEVMDAANDVNLRAAKKDLPKYSYPTEAVLAAQIYSLAKYGQTLKIPKAEAKYQNRLDAQRESGKDAFGGLFLISERAAAERAAAERAAATKWQLSEREREIIRGLSQ